jgi:hypothetical protein
VLACDQQAPLPTEAQEDDETECTPSVEGCPASSFFVLVVWSAALSSLCACVHWRGCAMVEILWRQPAFKATQREARQPGGRRREGGTRRRKSIQKSGHAWWMCAGREDRRCTGAGRL